MKPFKTTLHLWIVIASMLSFLVGWILLAHAPKPIQPAQNSTVVITPLPTLPPIQFFNNGFAPSTFQNSVAPNPQPNPQTTSGIPLLTTRGS